ncbi:MAG: MATE family efflux transporter [Eubacterium sp.]|nr:MATE family efflux transporter [Eubacterium sp.]
MASSNVFPIKDLTRGPVAGNLFCFSAPLILINVLQAVYNVADMAIAGHFTGASGITAISTGGQITNILLMLGLGLSNGCSIVTGQLVGSGHRTRLRELLLSILPIAGLAAAILSLGIGLFCHPILQALHVPAEAYSETRQYLLICLTGTVSIYLYNILASVLRGMGDSVHPMMFMTCSTVINIVLDYLFVGIFPFGVVGAAVATVLSQTCSMLLILLYMLRRTDLLRRGAEPFRFNRKLVLMVLKIGLPQAAQFASTQFSLLLVAGVVNSFGVIQAAAVGASNKAGTFAQLPGQALNAGILTTTAQNLPKQNYGRIKHSMVCAMLFGLIISGFFTLTAIVIPQGILGIFTDNTAVLAAGTEYLLLLSIGIMIENIVYATTGIVSGAGYTRITMAASMTSAVSRVYITYFLQEQSFGVFSAGLAALIAPCIPVIIITFILLSGKWKVSAIQRELSALG